MLYYIYNNIYGDSMQNNNKVIDYVTQAEACKIIGISEKSTPLINRWIKQGKIKGYRKIGRNVAIPVNWVKAECNTRNIKWQGVKLEQHQVGVSLDDYITLNEYAKKNNTTYSKTYKDTINKKLNNYVYFDNTLLIYNE